MFYSLALIVGLWSVVGLIEGDVPAFLFGLAFSIGLLAAGLLFRRSGRENWKTVLERPGDRRGPTGADPGRGQQTWPEEGAGQATAEDHGPARMPGRDQRLPPPSARQSGPLPPEERRP